MRLVLVGWGAIARETARHLDADAVEIVGVATSGSRRHDDVPPGATHITEPAELAALRPDVVAEAAGRASVEPWGRAAAAAGADLIVSSVSAFVDAALLADLRDTAAANRARIEIQPGALAGVEALAAARLMGIDHVEHHIVKPPAAWRGTPAEERCELGALTDATTFFTGDALATADAFPKNANVAMTTALAGIGPERTEVRLIADPAAGTNGHRLRAHGAFGSLDVSIDNAPLPGNPKSSAMAALSLARAITNRHTPIVI